MVSWKDEQKEKTYITQGTSMESSVQAKTQQQKQKNAFYHTRTLELKGIHTQRL